MIARRLQPGEKLWGVDSRTPYRAVGLVALLATGYVLYSILWPLRWSLLYAWVVIECIYYVFYFKPRFAALEEQPEVHRPADCNAQRGMAVFRRFLQFCRDLPRGVDYEQYYSGWFRGAPFEAIKRGEAPVSGRQLTASRHSLLTVVATCCRQCRRIHGLRVLLQDHVRPGGSCNTALLVQQMVRVVQNSNHTPCA